MKKTPLHPEFVALLVCPITKKSLQYRAETDELISVDAGLIYPIRDGVPILIPEEARTIEGRP